MDIRALVFGILAAISLIGAIVLAALSADELTIASLIGVATTLAGYIVGLYSSAFEAPTGVHLVDEPAGVTRANEHGRSDALGVLALFGVLIWTAGIAALVVFAVRSVIA